MQRFLFGLKGKPVVFFYAALDMSCDSLGYDRVALEPNADGAAINFKLHQKIKSAVILPLATARRKHSGSFNRINVVLYESSDSDLGGYALQEQH